MATDRPVSCAGGCGVTQPLAKAFSMISYSTRSMVTALRSDRHHAGRLARGGTEPSGELGKVVGCVQPFECDAPLVVIDEVVPLRNQVAQRTGVVTERDAAVHASAGLFAGRVLALRFVDLVPVCEAQLDRSALGRQALALKKSRWLTHERPP
jgi:hypothetical protein